MSFLEKAFNYKSDVWDIGLIKIAVFAATLLFAKLWPELLSLDWYWYAIVWIAAAIKPFYGIFRNKQ
ncbi:MAG: hypothetical protein KGZ42_08920 [Melioribacter sp.]|nr:hypothetical protein [Melioribacter sp.]